MPRINYFAKILTLIVLIIAVYGCKKPNEWPAKPTADTLKSYSFNNVNYPDQTVRHKLLDTLMLVINAANSPGATVTKEQLEKIYKNEISQFNSKANLEQVTPEADRNQILAWFDTLAVLSNITDKTLINQEGAYLPELIEKKILGSVFYNEAINKKLIPIETYNNLVVKKDSGTAMEHAWDEAFGYFGAAVTLDAKTNDDSLISKQGKVVFSFMTIAAKRDTGYNYFTNSPTNFTYDIYNSFMKGRDAISRNDIYPALIERDKILQNWERLIAASAATYIGELQNCRSLPENEVSRCLSKNWSEAKGTIEMLQYNPALRLGQPSDVNSNYNKILGFIGPTSSSASDENLTEAKKILTSTYSF